MSDPRLLEWVNYLLRLEATVMPSVDGAPGNPDALG